MIYLWFDSIIYGYLDIEVGCHKFNLFMDECIMPIVNNKVHIYSIFFLKCMLVHILNYVQLTLKSTNHSRIPFGEGK